MEDPDPDVAAVATAVVNAATFVSVRVWNFVCEVFTEEIDAVSEAWFAAIVAWFSACDSVKEEIAVVSEA